MNTTKIYIVWNEAKTEGFVTTDFQLAYEARKGSDSNCYDSNGKKSELAIKFCDLTLNENCSIEIIEKGIINE